jgi:hypothetical protein
MLKRPELFSPGYHLSAFSLPHELRDWVTLKDWTKIDAYFQEATAPTGALYRFVRGFHEFSAIEFIISVRDADNAWEEDGVWHDDGSRVFAFSLSLTMDPSQLRGGLLGLRRRGEEAHAFIETPEFGGIILFLTGTYGYEHRIHRVTQGQRVIIAGWCS